MRLLKNTVGQGYGWLISGSRELVAGEKVDSYFMAATADEPVLTESGPVFEWEDQTFPVPDGVAFEDLVFVLVGSWWALDWRLVPAGRWLW